MDWFRAVQYYAQDLPDCTFSAGDDYASVVWDCVHKPKPTEHELYICYKRYLEYQQANIYKEKRRNAYPSISDQLDMLYHDMVNKDCTWVKAIKEIKNKYPKGVKINDNI